MLWPILICYSWILRVIMNGDLLMVSGFQNVVAFFCCWVGAMIVDSQLIAGLSDMMLVLRISSEVIEKKVHGSKLSLGNEYTSYVLDIW